VRLPLQVVKDVGIDGIIVSNTTIARPEWLRSPHAAETGGLSGRPLFVPSTNMLFKVYQLTDGKVPLIGGWRRGRWQHPVACL